jgi:hypothetical protein
MWRRTLLNPLLQSTDKFNKCINLLQTNSMIGMIGCRRYLLTVEGQFLHLTNQLLQGFGWKPLPTYTFIGGTIFLVRFNLIEDWFNRMDTSMLTSQMVPRRPHNHMNIIYLLERMFGAIVQANGKSVHGVI